MCSMKGYVFLKCSAVQEEEAEECKWNKGASKAEQGEAASPNCTLESCGTAASERLRIKMVNASNL